MKVEKKRGTHGKRKVISRSWRGQESILGVVVADMIKNIMYI